MLVTKIVLFFHPLSKQGRGFFCTLYYLLKKKKNLKPICLNQITGTEWPIQFSITSVYM